MYKTRLPLSILQEKHQTDQQNILIASDMVKIFCLTSKLLLVQIVEGYKSADGDILRVRSTLYCNPEVQNTYSVAKTLCVASGSRVITFFPLPPKSGT